jgi:hypothetical protein
VTQAKGKAAEAAEGAKQKAQSTFDTIKVSPLPCVQPVVPDAVGAASVCMLNCILASSPCTWSKDCYRT